MPEVSAAAVKALRDKTNLPMMECKQALEFSGGDETAAVDWLRKQGKKTMESRSGRETSSGRIAQFIDAGKKVGAMIELRCESAPVANNEEFLALASGLAQQLALGPGAKTPEDLWKQPSPNRAGKTLGDQKDDLSNKIREVFNLARIVRFDGLSGGYVHHNGASGVLIEFEGGNPEVAKDIAMHTAAMRPQAVTKEELDPAVVAKEREILSAAARQEGKPENIIGKMVEGRLRNFYSERVLLEQPFVKDEKKTVGQLAKEAKLTIKRLVHWELGK
ncbi:MAG TPA: translation elongation factor Ts [Pirellulales bacterium]|nr:translation elongation factor Ts [Pirellulales bacterium]